MDVPNGNGYSKEHVTMRVRRKPFTEARFLAYILDGYVGDKPVYHSEMRVVRQPTSTTEIKQNEARSISRIQWLVQNYELLV